MAISTENAAEACKKISSEAENIIAQGESKAQTAKTIAGVIGGILGGPIGALINPVNWKGGNNKAEELTRNVIERDLSREQIQTIRSNCENTNISRQSNVIDNTMCPICEVELCTADKIRQNNVAEYTQSCVLQNAVKGLMSATDNLDAQILATVIQKTEGALSGDNKSNSEDCNIVRTDMSSKEYFDSRSECANVINTDQKNNLVHCGDMNLITQSNNRSLLQDCINKKVYESTNGLLYDTKTTTETKSEQKSTGITSTASIVGSIIFLVIFILFVSIIFSILLN